MFQWGARDLIERDVGKQDVIRISEEPLISGKVNKVHYIKLHHTQEKCAFAFLVVSPLEFTPLLGKQGKS